MVVPSAAGREMAPESLPLGIIPTVDMSAPCGELARRLVRACAERGFFKAVNHGVPPRVSARMDAAASAFFARPGQAKQAAGPPDPLGYGSRNIGANGDVGELEYLILHADPGAVARKAKVIDKDDPSRFRYIIISLVCNYICICMRRSSLYSFISFFFCSSPSPSSTTIYLLMSLQFLFNFVPSC